jgi:hypothetical protein
VIGADALAGWLETAPEPFFAWIHLVEPHLPYGASGYEAAEAKVKGSSGLERAQVSATVPLGAGFEFEPGDREKLRELYDADVVRMDAAIGRVLASLDRSSLAARTLVLFTADHGEELLDHGWIGHASTSGEAKLTDEVLRIPLVLRGPGVPAGLVAPALAQNVDVTPTLLELVGAAVPKEMQGVSLVAALHGRSPRRRLFFDTTPGGHLTPEARRSERLQGVGDGKRIHAERIGAPPRADDPQAPELSSDLAKFRKAQAKARLALLSRFGGVVRPKAEDVARWDESLSVTAPVDGERLRFTESRGTIRLEWKGPEKPPSPYWVEYGAGSGLLSTSGAFPVEEPHIAFGPFPIAFWNDISRYSPFRFRILDPSGKRRSTWRSFLLEPATKGGR